MNVDQTARMKQECESRAGRRPTIPALPLDHHRISCSIISVKCMYRGTQQAAGENHARGGGGYSLVFFAPVSVANRVQ